MSNNLLAGVALSSLFAGSAIAADLPARAPVYRAPIVVPFSWTGCYLGHTPVASGLARITLRPWRWGHISARRRTCWRLVTPAPDQLMATEALSVAVRSAATCKVAPLYGASKQISAVFRRAPILMALEC